ncbi:MAG TPA: NUDIX domain-containing protein [Vicinamibacterales bacterium]|nr:NUDIX domain-containing protein [Vicinamibacterales bacterium]
MPTTKAMTPVRDTVKVVLLNDADELLLMCMDDPTIRGIGEEYQGRFWTLIGGRIEEGEALVEAAAREILEETGLAREVVDFGPVVWYGTLDLILRGEPTHIVQQFIVARTGVRTVSLDHLTEEEAGVVTQVEWFSMDRLVWGDEIVYPTILPDVLPAIIAGDYPHPPLRIDLGASARRRSGEGAP